MPTGVVKNWFEPRGYGFIIPDHGNGDVFVHRHALLHTNNLTPGDEVTYQDGWNYRKQTWQEENVSVHIPASVLMESVQFEATPSWSGHTWWP